MRISDWSSDVCSSDLRSAAPFGIVYATDAKASRQVTVAGVFPEASHPAITYPIALLKTATSSEAASFRQFLISRHGQATFARYGFGSRSEARRVGKECVGT